MKIRNKKIAKMPDIVEKSVSTVDAVEKINRLQKSLRSFLFEREEEIRALVFAVIARQHVMLEGSPGIAKSMLARKFFGAITDFPPELFYRKQLTKTTQPEELFGAVNVDKLRSSEAVYEHNTRGALPKAVFAYLDEVYRASANLLPSTFSILNERVFHNGFSEQQCPLITAVGTANFQLDDEELEAFHDRWLIRIKVAPVGSLKDRLRMYRAALDRENQDYAVATIPLYCFTSLTKKIGSIEIEDSLLEIYDALIADMIRAAKSKSMKFSVTDRRRCEALKLVQTSALLRLQEKAGPEDLEALRFGLIPVKDAEAEALFSASFTNIVGDYEVRIEQKRELDTLEERIERIEANFDPKLTEEKMFAWYSKAKNVQVLMRGRPEKMKIAENQQRFDDLYAKLLKALDAYRDELQDSKYASQVTKIDNP